MSGIDIPFGINLLGYVSANLGLGTAAREYARTILSRNIPLRVFDIDPGHGRGGFDLSFQHLTVKDARDLPYAINVSIFGSVGGVRAIFPPDGLAVDGRLNVSMVWWELPDLPRHMQQLVQVSDVLLAGTEFIHSTLSNNVPGVPVLMASHPIWIPEGVKADRARFKLPTDGLLVFMGFEPHSDPARKNPFAAIEAFKRAYAGPRYDNCHLVIKLNNPNVDGKQLELLEEMHRQIHGHPRIHILQESLPYVDLLSLYASCDVFLSLHRSEGLGLVPLEAMRLGKAVIATGWSGNMSYMNYHNSCPVSFDFVAPDDSSHIYGPRSTGIRSHWAEPNVDHAAAWLRKLADDPAFRESLGRQAAADASVYHEMAIRADFVDELHALWENRHLRPARDRGALVKRARKALQISSLNGLSPPRRLLGRAQLEIQQLLERHLLWRLDKR